MATVYSDMMRDILMDVSQMGMESQVQAFGIREQNYGALTLAKRLQESQKIITTRSGVQTVQNTVNTNVLNQQTVQFRNIYGRRVGGTTTAPVRIGTGSLPVYNDNLNWFNMTQAGLQVSNVAQVIRQSSIAPNAIIDDKANYSVAYDAYRKEFAMGFFQTVRDIYEQIDIYARIFIEGNIWILSGTLDAGGEYNALAGDYKIVPAADAPVSNNMTNPIWLGKMATEARRNQFTQFGNPIIFHTSSLDKFISRYQVTGANNIADTRSIWTSKGMDFIVDDRLNSPAPTDLATMYMIANGAVTFYTRNPMPLNIDFGQFAPDGEVTKGNDTWAAPLMVGAGTSILPDFPTIMLGVKLYKGWNDSSATYANVPEAAIDHLDAYSYYAQTGMFTAKDYADANILPIIGYTIQ